MLPDGRIIHGLKALKKDNTGYDLKDLLIGAEGTLGIITAAVLKLFPLPAEKATAFVSLAKIDDALALLNLAEGAAGRGLTAFEFIPRLALEFVTRNVRGARDPFATAYPWYVLLEISGAKADGTAGARDGRHPRSGIERGLILDAVIASSLTQATTCGGCARASPKRRSPRAATSSTTSRCRCRASRVHRARQRGGRESLPRRPAVAGRPLRRRQHPLQHRAAGRHGQEGVRRHVGRRSATWCTASSADMDGSISAEHGIGRMKRRGLARFKSAVEMELMRGIKKRVRSQRHHEPGQGAVGVPHPLPLALSPATSGERAEAGFSAGRGRGAAACSKPMLAQVRQTVRCDH